MYFDLLNFVAYNLIHGQIVALAMSLHVFNWMHLMWIYDICCDIFNLMVIAELFGAIFYCSYLCS